MKKLGGILLALWLTIYGLVNTIHAYDLATLSSSILDIVNKVSPVLALASGVVLLVGYLTK